MVRAIFFSVFCACFFLAVCQAEDLGTFGETFAIKERDMREEILEKLLRLESDGGMEKERRNMQRQIAENVKNPKAVEGIEHTEKPRTFTFDPSIEVQRNLKDHRGKIFARKGERFNPLDRIVMTKPLIFIDGADEDHIFRAELLLKSYPTAKVILVGGSPFEVEKHLETEIYFDQQGHITSRLGIRRVPALVYQEEGKKVLTVKEIPALPEKFSKFPRQTGGKR
jgi:conjugal transfer pilus assembly protein TraW